MVDPLGADVLKEYWEGLSTCRAIRSPVPCTQPCSQLLICIETTHEYKSYLRLGSLAPYDFS